MSTIDMTRPVRLQEHANESTYRYRYRRQIKMGAFSLTEQFRSVDARHGRSPTHGVPAFAETVRGMLQETNAVPETQVGVAAPGVPAKDSRSIAYQPGKMHGIEGFDWGAFLEREVPVLNDAHAARWVRCGRCSQGETILLTLSRRRRDLEPLPKDRSVAQVNGHVS
jgi:predicted NBD/HSP70 family sugar kinase